MTYSIFIVALALIGGVTSLYIFYKKRKDEDLVCIIGEHCNVVVRSKYSSFFGIPNEVLGILYYSLVILIFPFLALQKSPPLPFSYDLFIVCSFAACSYSFYLTYVQFFVLKKICGLCLVANLINALVFLSVLYISLSFNA
jgi:uncharacterized membrane protein